MIKLRDWMVIVLAWLYPLAALAQLKAPAKDKIPKGLSTEPLVNAIYQIINVFLVLAGIAAVIFLIIAGVRYIGARGNEEEARAARNSILYAVIGLLLIGLAAAIVRFVISAAGGGGGGVQP